MVTKRRKEEVDCIKTNKVWHFVDISKECKTIEDKWILKVKCKFDGSIERHKARLVAMDFTPEIRIVYEESFSQILKFTSIQLLLPIVAHLGIKLHQMDVKTIFFNGESNKAI